MRHTPLRLFIGYADALGTALGNVIFKANKTDQTPALRKLTFLVRETAKEQVDK